MILNYFYINILMLLNNYIKLLIWENIQKIIEMFIIEKQKKKVLELEAHINLFKLTKNLKYLDKT